MPVLCNDCRHILLHPTVPEVFLCGHLAAIDTTPPSLVTGKPGPSQVHCSTMRLKHLVAKACGPEGRYFEPKTVGFV